MLSLRRRRRDSVIAGEQHEHYEKTKRREEKCVTNFRPFCQIILRVNHFRQSRGLLQKICIQQEAKLVSGLSMVEELVDCLNERPNRATAKLF